MMVHDVNALYHLSRVLVLVPRGVAIAVASGDVPRRKS